MVSIYHSGMMSRTWKINDNAQLETVFLLSFATFALTVHITNLSCNQSYFASDDELVQLVSVDHVHVGN